MQQYQEEQNTMQKFDLTRDFDTTWNELTIL